jgi:hypothetical protein
MLFGACRWQKSKQPEHQSPDPILVALLQSENDEEAGEEVVESLVEEARTKATERATNQLEERLRQVRESAEEQIRDRKVKKLAKKLAKSQAAAAAIVADEAAALAKSQAAAAAIVAHEVAALAKSQAAAAAIVAHEAAAWAQSVVSHQVVAALLPSDSDEGEDSIDVELLLEAARAEMEAKNAQMIEEEVRLARTSAEERVQDAKEQKLAANSARTAAVAAATAQQAAAEAHSIAAEMERVVVCQFDSYEGFALNDSARAYCVARWTQDVDEDTSDETARSIFSTIKVDFSLLKEATNNFHETHLLGQGGCSKVFKGAIYGYTTAIKVFNENDAAWSTQQIEAEIAHLCHIRHPHINKLLAVSFNGPCRCLVLEYMDNGALDTRLRRTPALQWHERTRILLHAALGLVHMHSLSPVVVHR